MNIPPVLAQEQNSKGFFNNLPAPLTSLINTFKKIQPNQNLIERTFSPQNIENNWFEKLKEWIRRIDEWFQKNIGVGFLEILKNILNFFVWILELIIKLIKLAISAI